MNSDRNREIGTSGHREIGKARALTTEDTEDLRGKSEREKL